MATSYSKVSYGSSGNDVKNLQTLLNNNGYSLTVDGIFGKETQAAVKDYQSKNNLTVDGIVGNNTWGTLTAASSSAENTTEAQEVTAQAPDYSVYQYAPSENAAYQEAMAALQQAQKATPTYQGTYDQQLDALYQQIVGRKDFSWNMNEDAFYQQAVDQYTKQGQMAMMDTMGQAAALTGGYGNTYAQNAGQQAYQGYLQQLGELAPEYYQMALDRYNQEGDAMLQQYSMLGDLADREYGMYQDEMDQHWQNLSYLQSQADTAYERGAENWYNAYQMGTDADNTAYSRQQDAYDRLVTMMTGMGYQPTDEELAAAGMTREQAEAYLGYYNQNNSSYSGGSTSPPVTNDEYLTADEAKSIVDYSMPSWAIANGKSTGGSNALIQEVVWSMTEEGNDMGRITEETAREILKEYGIEV